MSRVSDREICLGPSGKIKIRVRQLEKLRELADRTEQYDQAMPDDDELCRYGIDTFYSHLYGISSTIWGQASPDLRAIHFT